MSNASLKFSTTGDFKYDVFLSFRGKDTRKNFTDHLYTALVRNGFVTYKDDEEIDRGNDISPALLKAIQNSRLSIIVLSKNFAASSWCLDELVHILECMKARKTVLPIFYDVDPTVVRHQTDSFAESFANHEQKYGHPSELRSQMVSAEALADYEEMYRRHSETVKRWRVALTAVANLSGCHLNDGHESKFIQNIVEEVAQKLKDTSEEILCPLNGTIYRDISGKWYDASDELWSNICTDISGKTNDTFLVGIEPRVNEVLRYLNSDLDDTHIVGIWGMSGLGKTTIAKLVYDMICDQYEACSFVANVREISQNLGLVALQEHLLLELLLGKKISIRNVQEGIALLRYWICNKRVLIVLDDADGLDQLNALAGNPDWFGIGSRIIITSRNVSLLHDHGVKHMYLCESLHDDEALKLLSFNAFKQNHPIKGFEKMCSHVVKYAHGIPIILKVLGSFLRGKGINQWIQALGTLERVPQQTGFNIIRIGFDSLQETEKDIFLHVACFFKGKQIDCVVRVLDCSLGFFTKIVIEILIDKSLVYISNNILCMHSFVQEIGREIVRQECTSDPGKRSRLWHHEDINDVMMRNSGTEAIEAIVLDLPELECYWNSRCFSRLDNLRFLSIRSIVHLPQGFNHLPKNLRFLKWREYPLEFLPSNFYPPLLVELNMCYSQIVQLWNGEKFLHCLKFIKLSHSWNLTKTPDFTGVPNLERLVLEDCRNLIEVHPSIGILKRLRLVNMRDCTSVTNLPSAISMECLESYVLSGCSKLDKFPDIVGPMQYLSQPNLDRTAIKNLPKSIEHLAGLASINRRNCNYLSSLLSGMPNLTKLDLRDCNLPEGAIPSNIGCLTKLEVLDLSRNKFLTLPPSISQLTKLKFLGLAYCSLLESVPELPANITCVEARDCSSLVTFSKPISLFTSTELVLSFINCYQLTDGCKSMAITWLKAYLRSILNTQNQELSHRIGRFDIIIPGTRIPEWFRHQNIGSSITVQLPPNWRNDNWIGFVFCIAFGVHEHPFYEDDHLDSEKSHEISCQLYTNEGRISTGFGFCIPEGTMFKSDHLWLRYMSNGSFKERMVWWNRISYLEVSFGTPSPCLDVKMCGFRAVYKQDMEEIKNKKFHYIRPPIEDLGIKFFSFDAQVE